MRARRKSSSFTPLSLYVFISAVFQEAEDANARSYFNEVTAGVSDIEFTHDGRYIISRDYLTLKVRGHNVFICIS